jgi:hypothetical protein
MTSFNIGEIGSNPNPCLLAIAGILIFLGLMCLEERKEWK